MPQMKANGSFSETLACSAREEIFREKKKVLRVKEHRNLTRRIKSAEYVVSSPLLPIKSLPPHSPC